MDKVNEKDVDFSYSINKGNILFGGTHNEYGIRLDYSENNGDVSLWKSRNEENVNLFDSTIGKDLIIGNIKFTNDSELTELIKEFSDGKISWNECTLSEFVRWLKEKWE